MSRKNIYIIIIVVCMTGTAGVLYFGFRSPSPPAPSVVQNTPTQTINQVSNVPTQTTSSAGVAGGSVRAPAVFPLDTHFDWTLLDSPQYKSLVPVPDLTLDPSQVGRANPFSAK